MGGLRRAGLLGCTLSLAFVLVPHNVEAQGASIYASGTTDGYDNVSAVLGTSVHLRDRGWTPVGSLQLLYVQYDGTEETVNRWTVGPAVGLGYRASQGQVQAKVGYNFLLSDGLSDDLPGGVDDTGGEGFTTSANAQHWGRGGHDLMAIGSYNWKSEYLWSQLNASKRLVRTDAGSFSLGVQYTWHGEMDDQEEGDPRAWAHSIGPLFRWNNDRNFIFHVSPGWTDRNADEPTWYVNVGVVRYGINF